MDVAMSVSSAIAEIHDKSKTLGMKELFISGMHVGKDMMGTMSNTLILAFAGGSISVLVLDYAYNLPLRQIINSYSIGIEIMQGIAGSIGVILTVPTTAFMAALLYGAKEISPCIAVKKILNEIHILALLQLLALQMIYISRSGQ